jgi:hypothetical protein
LLFINNCNDKQEEGSNIGLEDQTIVKSKEVNFKNSKTFTSCDGWYILHNRPMTRP